MSTFLTTIRSKKRYFNKAYCITNEGVSKSVHFSTAYAAYKAAWLHFSFTQVRHTLFYDNACRNNLIRIIHRLFFTIGEASAEFRHLTVIMYKSATLNRSQSADVSCQAIILPNAAQPTGPIITEIKLVIPV